MASWLVYLPPDHEVQVRGHCVVHRTLKTLNFQSASVHPGSQMGSSKINSGGNPPGVSRNTPSGANRNQRKAPP